MPEILLVDDEIDFRNLLQKKLKKEGYSVSAVGSAKEALEEMKQKEFDVAILDISLPDISGIQLLEQIQKKQLSTECIMLTGYASIDSAIEAMKLGAYDYLEKPGKISEIKLIVKKAYEKCKLARENKRLKEERKRYTLAYKMIGASKAMEKIREIIDKVAQTDSSVLIEGESGTGKELIAREIHAKSRRAEAPFISLDCGAVPESLFENELFGHAKGAFTGADKEKIGLLELAHNGTLFIDEVGELAPNMQKKFLRFLETGEFRRLGETQLRHSKVRVIAATNRVLKDEVKKNNFREDLYYRLNVVHIQAVPLKQRKEDIPLLVEHFLHIFRSPQGKIKKVHPDVLEAFQKYNWPGNIRELRNIIERAVILSSSDTITLEDIPDLLGEELDETTNLEISPLHPQDENFPTLASLEKEHIQKALERSQNNKTKAAASLGISLRSLYRKIEKYKLE